MEESASGRLLQEESKKEGAVAFHVYRAYWRAIGLGLALAILASLLLMQGRNKPRSPYPTHSLVFQVHHILPCGVILTKPKTQQAWTTAETIGLPPVLRESQKPDRCTL